MRIKDTLLLVGIVLGLMLVSACYWYVFLLLILEIS